MPKCIAIALSLALAVMATAQDTRTCFTNDADGKLKAIPCSEVPTPVKTRTVEWQSLPAKKNHHTRNLVIWLSAGALAGGIYSWVSRAHCDHYEYGQNGVGVNCPKYPANGGWPK